MVQHKEKENNFIIHTLILLFSLMLLYIYQMFFTCINKNISIKLFFLDLLGSESKIMLIS